MIARALPALARTSQGKRKRELGSDLFVLYVQLNEMYIAGQLSVGQVEKYVRRMKNGDEPDGYSYFTDCLRSKLQAD